MPIGGGMCRIMEKCRIFSGVERNTKENIGEKVWRIQRAIKERINEISVNEELREYFYCTGQWLLIFIIYQ